MLLQGFLFLGQGALLHLRLQGLGTKFDVGILQVFLRLPGYWDWGFIARCFACVDCEYGAYKDLHFTYLVVSLVARVGVSLARTKS